MTGPIHHKFNKACKTATDNYRMRFHYNNKHDQKQTQPTEDNNFLSMISRCHLITLKILIEMG